MTAAATRLRAADMIERHGQPVTITRRAAGSYNTATSSAAITTSTQAGMAVILPLTAFRKGQANVAAGDRQMLLSALNSSGVALTDPKVDDTVTLASGEVVAITAIDQFEPAGTALIYDAIVRATR